MYSVKSEGVTIYYHTIILVHLRRFQNIATESIENCHFVSSSLSFD